MARNAGVVTINLTAGTAQFVQDLNAGKAAVRDFGSSGTASLNQFGHAGVSQMQATSAAIREAFGGSNIRAVERFLTTIPGVGAAIQAAFPLIGLAAFGGLLVDVGEKVYKFFKYIQTAPERIAGAFRDINAPLVTANDELRVAIDRVNNDIAKLQGKRQNNLAIALDESRVAADKLADSLANDAAKLNKFLSENNVGFLKGLFTNQSSTTDVKKFFGGESGFGGFTADTNKINADAQAKIADAATRKDLEGIKQIEQARDASLQRLNRTALAFIDGQITKLTDAQKAQVAYDGYGRKQGIKPGEDNTAGLEILRAARNQIVQQSSSVNLQAQLNSGNRTKSALQADNANSKIGKPYTDAIEQLNAQLLAAKENLEAVGEDDAGRQLAKAFGEAQEKITELNKQLKDAHQGVLSPDQEANILSLKTAIVQTTAETAYQDKLKTTNETLKDRISTLQNIGAAIGKSYDAVRAANVEKELISTVGAKNYNDPSRQSDNDAIRSKLGTAYDQENVNQIKSATDALGDQIELEKSLAAAQAQGVEVTARVTLAYQLQAIVHKQGASASYEQVKALIALFDAQEKLADGKYLQALKQEETAVVALTRAQIQSGEAARQQALQNQRTQLISQGKSPAAADAAIANEELKYRLGIVEAEAKAVHQYTDELTIIEQKKAALDAIVKVEGETTDTIRVRKDLEDDILKIQRDQALASGKLSDGLRAFVLDSQIELKKPGQILYDGLQSALDKTSDGLAKLFTGQKVSFGKIFQDVGDQIAGESIKEALKKGIGSIGGALGIDPKKINKSLGIKSQDGQTPASAWWVQVVGAQGGAPSQKAPANGGTSSFPRFPGGFKFPGFGGFGGAGGGSPLDEVFRPGASSGIEDVSSSVDFGGFLANGGPVDPGSSYIVGDGGEPEVFSPGTSGTVTPMSKFGGGGTNITNHIDARGTDPVMTERAVKRGSQAAYQNSVVSSSRVADEKAKRRPS